MRCFTFAKFKFDFWVRLLPLKRVLLIRGKFKLSSDIFGHFVLSTDLMQDWQKLLNIFDFTTLLFEAFVQVECPHFWSDITGYVKTMAIHVSFQIEM